MAPEVPLALTALPAPMVDSTNGWRRTAKISAPGCPVPLPDSERVVLAHERARSAVVNRPRCACARLPLWARKRVRWSLALVSEPGMMPIKKLSILLHAAVAATLWALSQLRFSSDRQRRGRLVVSQFETETLPGVSGNNSWILCGIGDLAMPSLWLAYMYPQHPFGHRAWAPDTLRVHTDATAP